MSKISAKRLERDERLNELLSQDGFQREFIPNVTEHPSRPLVRLPSSPYHPFLLFSELTLTLPPLSDYVTGSGGEIDETLLEATQTNASLFLTVYPTTTLDLINSTSLTLLGKQILEYQSSPYNRSVFLRYAPEMQGDW